MRRKGKMWKQKQIAVVTAKERNRMRTRKRKWLGAW